MKKSDAKKLALMGITGALMLTSHDLNADSYSNSGQTGNNPGNTQNNLDTSPNDMNSNTERKEPIPRTTGNNSRYRSTSGNGMVGWRDGGGSSCNSKNGCGGTPPARGNLAYREGGSSCNSKNGCGGTPPPRGNFAYSEGGSSCNSKNGCGGTLPPRGNFAYNDPAGSMDTDKNQNPQNNPNPTPADERMQEREEQFVKKLDHEGRRIYNSLDPEGKELAQRLSKQYLDKNQAVRHAARLMVEKNADNAMKRQNLSN